MSENNTQIKPIEIDLTKSLLKLWKKKFTIMIISVIAAFSGFGLSYLIPVKYEISCLIAPIFNDDANMLANSASIASLLTGGIGQSDVSKEIIKNANTREFLAKIYHKYSTSSLIFEQKLSEIATSSLPKIQKQEKMQEEAIKILKKKISFTYIPKDDQILVSVELEDKYFAREFLLDVLHILKDHIKQKNLKILEEDIENYKQIIASSDNSVVKGDLSTLLTKKINRYYTVTANAFSIVDPPVIPYSKSSPKRSLFAIGTMIAGFIASLAFSLISKK